MIDTIVVGSGYGGSVVAARLAGTCEVLLLERGRDWPLSELPRSLGELTRSYLLRRRRPLGLWEFRFGRGTGTVSVSALGGASLVNYGITARPDPHIFDTWPVSWGEMQRYYDRALGVLSPSSAPVGEELLDKEFLDRIEPGRRVDLENTINWEDCTYCGHCVPGCREGAKLNLTRTYLALARERGLRVRAETEVVGVEPLPVEGYRLQVRSTANPGRVETLECRRLVLSAGTFGTMDLLHRMRSKLPLSSSFGQRVSMNGDALAFLYNTCHSTSGDHGAPLTTSVRLRFRDHEEKMKSLLVMSGRIPRSMAYGSGFLLSCFSGLLGQTRGPVGVESRSRRLYRRIRDLWSVGAGGALSHSFMYKLDAQDSAAGVVRFTSSGRGVVDWPGYARDPILRAAVSRLHRWADRVGGTVVLLPGLHRAMKGFSVHTLGGCRMGSSPSEGVVDSECRVFRPDGEVYDGFYIVDSTVCPSSLGVPPSLTISAVAERAAEAMLG